MTGAARAEGSEVAMEWTATAVWQKYETAKDYLHRIDLVGRTDKAHRFYLGDQWAGVQAGGEELPMYNFIKPIVRYKVAIVAQNTMGAVYSPMGTEKTPEESRACELLTAYFGPGGRKRRWTA